MAVTYIAKTDVRLQIEESDDGHLCVTAIFEPFIDREHAQLYMDWVAKTLADGMGIKMRKVD